MDLEVLFWTDVFPTSRYNYYYYYYSIFVLIDKSHNWNTALLYPSLSATSNEKSSTVPVIWFLDSRKVSQTAFLLLLFISVQWRQQRCLLADGGGMGLQTRDRFELPCEYCPQTAWRLSQEIKSACPLNHKRTYNNSQAELNIYKREVMVKAHATIKKKCIRVYLK